MQRIERYGVIALVFLLVTILAVSFWGESKQDLITSEESPADELVASAPASALPVARTSPATSRGARDRALPTSDTSRARDAVPRDRDHSRNPNVLDPEPADPLAGRHARAREALPTPATAPDQPLERNAPARDELRRAAVPPAATDYVPVEIDTRTTRTGEAAARPGATAAAPGTRTCVVGGGETLSQISQRELGTYKRWREIAALNGNLDPARLQKGMVLVLPPRDSAQAAQLVAAATAAPVPASRPAEPAPRAPAAGTYTVQKGDVLSLIAQRELGSSKRWREIVALNPKVDPDRLIVGARLVLPTGAAAAPRTASAPARTDGARTGAAPAVSSGVARAEPAPRGGWSGGQAGGKVR